MYLVFKRTVKDQRSTKNQRRNNRSSPLGEIRTKERPKNSEIEKKLFIKIALSFTSLIPCLIPPTDDRETTERTPTQLPANKKCFFLRLLSFTGCLIPEKVVSLPKKVDSFPKIVDSFPKSVVLSTRPLNKNRTKNAIFICSIQNISLPLHPYLVHAMGICPSGG